MQNFGVTNKEQGYANVWGLTRCIMVLWSMYKWWISNSQCITALFTNMRIVKFKSQLTIAFFAAVNHLNGPPRKQNFTLTGSKGHHLWCDQWIWIRFVCFCVSRFVAFDSNYDWRQWKTQYLWRRLLHFRVWMFVKSAVICRYMNVDL